jgi:hypothetical protein
VGEHQRHGVLSLATLVDEVQPEAVDLDAEVGEAVEPFLLLSPVEAALPVPHQLAHVGEVRPVVPARTLYLVWPAGAGEAFVQVIEDLLRNPHLERLDVHVGALCHVRCKSSLQLAPLSLEMRSK